MDGIPLVRAFSWYLKPCESNSFLIGLANFCINLSLTSLVFCSLLVIALYSFG